MSWRANTLLVLALASGLAYGRFAVPFFLATASDDVEAAVEEPAADMFPDGCDHDFGKVRRGPLLQHAFRIVNTSGMPLRIIGLRAS
jgi:hypothetical protein